MKTPSARITVSNGRIQFCLDAKELAAALSKCGAIKEVSVLGKPQAVRFDNDRHEVFIGGVETVLAPAEYRVLKDLYDTGKVRTREQLAQAIGVQAEAVEQYACNRVVDQHVARLRRKLRAERGSIKTVAGVGYKFCA